MSKCDKDTEITDRNLRQFVGYNMKRAFLTVREDLARVLEPQGLRMTSFSALAIIKENPDISQTRLAEALHIERSGVVVLVDELESADLIERGRVEGDRRQYALRTTALGDKKWREAERAVEAHEDALFAALTDEERTRLKALLGRVGRTQPPQTAQWEERMKDQTTGLTLAPHSVRMDRKSAGEIILTSALPLDPVVEHTGVWLEKWASERPDHVYLAERSGAGWRELGYAEVLQRVKAIAASLAARGLNESTPILIMSGNSVDHALLSFGAQWAGVPTVPLAEQYSLIEEAHFRLQYAIGKTKPKMAFVDDAARYAKALTLSDLDGIEIVASRAEGAPRPVTPFAELLKGDAGVDLSAVHAQVGPDTLAKILFTSGSSSDPKGVMTTQRMMCANQSQMVSVLPFTKERPPRIVDWLPWNHVFGGSHNVNMMLMHGGSFYIDNGKPTKALFRHTIDNITDKAGTFAFNVPVGFSMLVHEMEHNMALREAYFKDLDMLFYAGASLPQDIWTRLEEMAMEVRGRLPLMISSWGLTETAPANVMVHEHIGRSGVIGVPLPGIEIKLLPDDDMRCEIRVKGPNVMPGYLNDPEKTAEAFDEEGFFITGDAVKFLDNDDPNRGLVFDGRVSEDFKLLTGTWVQAGKLRLDALEALRGLVLDVVVCGHDRGEIGLFVFPRPDHVHDDNTSEGAVIDDHLQAEIHHVLRKMARAASGSAKRIARAIILSEPPSLKDGEITDKGSLNTRKIITRRADLLERLYDNEDPALIRV